MTLIGNADGKLHAYRQVDDYALRGVVHESMGYLTFIVETYERRKATAEGKKDDESFEDLTEARRLSRLEDQLENQSSTYLFPHPKSKTHLRVRRSEKHNFCLILLDLGYLGGTEMRFRNHIIMLRCSHC
jgi:hypothetical protein